MPSNRELRAFGLETFSFWCAQFLLGRHPEWLPFVKGVEGEQDGMKVRTLAIDLPSSNPRVPEPLTLSVDFDRIVAVSWFSTGGTSRWHRDWVFYMRHHPRPSRWGNDHDGLDEVVAFVESLLDEEIAAVWTEDVLGGGGAFWSASADEVRVDAFRKGKVRTEIRSWRGSLDRSL